MQESPERRALSAGTKDAYLNWKDLAKLMEIWKLRANGIVFCIKLVKRLRNLSCALFWRYDFSRELYMYLGFFI